MTDIDLPEYWRSSGRVADVSKRVITVIAVPYDEDTEINEPDGRQYVESFDRKAFDGITTRTNRIPVNRDHDGGRLVGKVLAFHPTRREGLVAELRMTPDVPLADETLAFARDDVLGASISFGAAPTDIEWFDQGRRRRVMRARLNHIALTPEPAYAGAAVLDVRHRPVVVGDPSATPLLDAVLAEWAADELRSRFKFIDD